MIKCFSSASIIALFLCVTLFAQKQNSAATSQLAVLSEKFADDDIEEVNRLILANADVNVRNIEGVTPLCVASAYGHVELVKLLLAADADVDAARKKDSITALYMASWQGHPEIVKLLLAANAKTRKTGSKSPLWTASYEGHTEVVKLLLAANASVEVVTTITGSTPLWIASQNGHTEVVELLLAANADVDDVTTDDSMSALYMASQSGHIEVVKLLLVAGADVHAATTYGITPLDIASKKGHAEIVKLLAVELMPKTGNGTNIATGTSLRDRTYDSRAGCAEDLDEKAVALQSRGIGLFHDSDPKTVELLEEAVRIEPRLIPARAILCYHYAYNVDINKAITEAKLGLLSCNSSPELHDLMGQVYSIAGETRMAISSFQTAIELGIHPASVAYFNIGNQFYKQEDVDSAVVYYERAIEIDPLYIKALKSLVISLIDKGDKNQALMRIKHIEHLDTDGRLRDWTEQGRKEVNNLR